MYVSVLFNEPKLLKSTSGRRPVPGRLSFSALQRAEIAEMKRPAENVNGDSIVSVLFNEPKLLKFVSGKRHTSVLSLVSVLFNEPKLLKSAW